MPVVLFIRGAALSLVALSLVAALHVYLGLRLIRDPHLPPAVATAAWTLLGLMFLSLPVGLAASRSTGGLIAQISYWVSHLWMGAFGLLLVTVAGSDGVSSLLWVGFHSPTSSALLWSQWQAGAVLAVTLPALGFGFASARGPATLEQVPIDIASLGSGLEGLRIVQLSDVHIGQTLGRRFLERTVARVNALDPDIVAITGDLIDGQVAALKDDLAPLAGLKAKLGVFFVTGNHEYYHGGPAWEAEVRRLGLTVLHNEHRVLERDGDRLVIAGVTDHDAGHFGAAQASRPDLAFAGAPEGIPRILLAHQPRSARAATGLKVDLQLSGHTHGGQMFPWMFFVRLQQPVISGLRQVGEVRVYTSRGTGYWGPPKRFGAPSEITLLRLVLV